MEGVLRQGDIAPLLRDHYVGLAAEADAPEAPVLELAARHLRDAMMLPFVLFVDAEGNYLDGSHGAVDPVRFRETLERLAE